MICNICRHKLPEDSEFCQYCGNKLGSSIEKNQENIKKPEKVVVPKAAVKDSLIPQNQKKSNDKFCNNCGCSIAKESKICTNCGKKQFKGILFNKVSITIIILSLMLVISSTLNISQFIKFKTLQDKIADLEGQVSSSESTIFSLKNQIGELNDEVDELRDENWDNSFKIEFFDKYAVLVNENSRKYHKYGCEDFDTSSFWIYNINAAEDKGYYACPECH